MQKLIILSLAILIILSSCKLKDDTSTSTTNPVEPGTGVVTIKVVLPNGGESYKNGSIEIIWTTFAVPRVNVYYSIDNGVTWVPLQSNIQSTGGYVWVYPAGMISGQARIKVEDASNAALYDVSDGFFYIGVDKPVGSVSPKAEIKKLPKK